MPRTPFKPNLFRDGTPRYVRCYDNGGESMDRYIVVYTGRYTHKTGGEFWYACMNSMPFHPQGIGQHDSSPRVPIDRPRSGHLGKRIPFTSLPDDCRRLVLSDYVYLWDTLGPNGEQPMAD